MGDRLNIFDFDYTLYRTAESIIVWSPRGSGTFEGKTGFKLSPEEFHSYELGSDEEINDDSFNEFDFIDWSLAKPIKPVLDIFNNCQNKLILTAREQKVEPDIRKKFDDSIPFIGLGSGDVQDKIKKINELKRDHGTLCVYEDNYPLINFCISKDIPCVYVSSKPSETILKFFNY